MFRTLSILALAAVLAASAVPPSANADSSAQAPSGSETSRCYGLLVFIGIYPSTGETAAAAWVVGPFSSAQCASQVKLASTVVPSPLKGARHLTNVFSGSAAQIRLYLEHAYGCVRNESYDLSGGPDGIRGIYACAPP